MTATAASSRPRPRPSDEDLGPACLRRSRPRAGTTAARIGRVALPWWHAQNPPSTSSSPTTPVRTSSKAASTARLVAHSEYELAPGVITFLHTEVDPAFEGQGIGSALASSVLDDVRARGLRVVARCPFIAAYIRRHREYADLLLRTKVGGSRIHGSTGSAGSGGEPAA